ncbi:MAG TPA: ATP-binding protein [Gaiellaceae bacterium]|jgi:serine/threonine-protein kinase RsbW|nr:ATP-binding protein [Gaiellaceae bacterium]
MASISMERTGVPLTRRGARVALTIPARPEYVALCRLALTGLARTRALAPELVADLKLALTEACSNSVRHAYEEGREGIVEVHYELAGDRIEVEVTDDGAGFDPEVIQRAQEELDEGGLGIAIIRAITDELEIGARDGGGSRLRFTKYIP